METKCKQCRKLFKTKKSLLAKGLGKFCCKKCYGKWLSKNRKRWGVNDPTFPKERIEDWKNNIRKSRTGQPAWNKGIKTGIIPKSAYKKGENIGEEHPRWKGGRWLYWRKQALIRDNYTCQICGLREPEIMDVHHKIPVLLSYQKRMELEKNNLLWKERLKNGLDNLQTVCPNCHRRLSLNHR
jgi:hypothetical protein